VELTVGALASDYDGTLATHGEVGEATLRALQRLKASGRKLLMVTGRELLDLKRVFAHLGLFDAVVAENGALLYRPDLGEERLLAAPAPPELIAALKRRGVGPLAVGRSIVAAPSEQAAEVEAVIAELGLGWRTILNKDSVMCLPPGVDKASGLTAALAEMDLAPAEVLGVGDAENDLHFLAICGLAAAVANALPQVKAAADIVTEGEDGAGVAWLIDRLLAGELSPQAARAC
jgi:hydroxymethylpyrimidine pyrophosphatase-like HAD family hydrolase